jgi:hypothetical protein
VVDLQLKTTGVLIALDDSKTDHLAQNIIRYFLTGSLSEPKTFQIAKGPFEGLPFFFRAKTSFVTRQVIGLLVGKDDVKLPTKTTTPYLDRFVFA